MSVLIAKPSNSKAIETANIATINHRHVSVPTNGFGEEAKLYSTSNAKKAEMIRIRAAAPRSLATDGFVVCGETRATITVSKRPLVDSNAIDMSLTKST